VAGGPIAVQKPADAAVPHGRRGGPPCRGTPRYTENDSYSTDELDIDWQGVTLYNPYFARWWAGASAARAALPSAPSLQK
jgi:hypothetical protein